MINESFKIIPYQLDDWLFDPDVVTTKGEMLVFDTKGEELRFTYLPDSLKWHQDYLTCNKMCLINIVRVKFNGVVVGDGKLSLAITIKAKEKSTHLVPLNGYIDIALAEVERVSLNLLFNGKGTALISSIDFISPQQDIPMKKITSLKDLSIACSGDVRIERFLGDHLSPFLIEPDTWKEDFLKVQPDVVLLDNYKLSLWMENTLRESDFLDFLKEMCKFCGERGILLVYMKLDFTEQISFMDQIAPKIFDVVYNVDKASELRTRNHFNIKAKKIKLDAVAKIRSKLQKENKLEQLQCFLQQLGIEIEGLKEDVCVLSVIGNKDEFKRALSMYQKQSWKNKRLVLIVEAFLGREELMGNQPEDIVCLPKEDLTRLKQEIPTSFTALFCPHCYYGINYLEDLVLSAMHTGCSAAVKGSYGKMEDSFSYCNEELQFVFLDEYGVDIKKAVINTSLVNASYYNFVNLYEGRQAFDEIAAENFKIFSIDKYNFIENLKFPLRM